MLLKKFTPKRTICKVTFTMPAEVAEKEVALAGEFNDWDATPLKLDPKKSEWTTEVKLKPENEYKFKYLIDGKVWENDFKADAYIPNEFGTEDSLVSIGK